MKRKHIVYLGLIAVLGLANLWRWWPHAGAGTGKSAVRGKKFFPEDFRLRVDSPDAAGRAGRNLFQPHVHRATATRVREAPRVVAPQPSVQFEIETGLGKLKLLGVVFHAGKRQAYLALDKESVIASAGDTVFGQFALDRVNVDEVELRDLKTNTTRRIPVSGK